MGKTLAVIILHDWKVEKALVTTHSKKLLALSREPAAEFILEMLTAYR